MTNIAEQIREELNEDIISHGWLIQCIELAGQSQAKWEPVLTELLSGDVEIGETRSSPDYVEFIAWKGAIEERVARARERVKCLTGPDREFAYWLALRKNADRFEV